MSLRPCLATGLLALAGIAGLRAQTYSYISGIILDSSTASVPGAAVSVVNEDTGLRRTTVSQTDGSYIVSPLEAGVYKIIVRTAGFRTMIRFGVAVGERHPARVDFKLVVGSVQETITVEGTAPATDGDNPAVATIVRRDDIDRLPVNGGGVLKLLELAPGLVVTPATRGEAGQFTVNGQRPNTHYFMVDGASANSGVSGGGLPAQSTGGALPGMTAFGSLDSIVSLGAIEEMRVDTSSTTAAFGRLPGAQISITSRAGSNEWHGSAQYQFRDRALQANNWFANQQGDPRAGTRLNDFAGALGGPIRRDRTFFFASYEGMRLSQPSVWRQPTPSAAARASAPDWVAPVLNLFPPTNGPDLGSGLALWTANLSRPATLNVGAARLDQAISSRVSAFARYSESPSSVQYGANPIDDLDLESRSLTIGLTLRARSNLLIDSRLNGSVARTSSTWRQAFPGALPDCYAAPLLTTLFAGWPCDTLTKLSITGVGQVVLGSEGRRRQSQFQVGQTMQWDHGTHSVSLGADYRRLDPVRRDAAGMVSIIADTVNSLAQTGDLWTATSARQLTSATLEEISVFAQDTWRIAPRLTGSFGARWEISPGPMPGSPANFLDPALGYAVLAQRPLWSTYANFAPRGGLALRLDTSGRTVLRVGGGLYYDSSLSLATDLINDGPLNVSQYHSVRSLFVSTLLEFGFPPNLQLPLITQWNASIERAVTSRDLLTISYVGSAGRDLIRREIGGAGSSSTIWLALATNHGVSDYRALDVQYRRRLSRGVQGLASYSWSHSIDNSSTDAGLYWAGPGVSPSADRASSDFDVRHSFTAGLTWDLPGVGSVLRGWSMDTMFRARSGFPINVLNAEQYTGIGFENVFRPDLMPGQPVWVADGSAPGGRRLNPAAFAAAAGAVQGNLGRNALTGFGMSQWDLALRREFLRSDRRALELRVEAYNALNHPDFADPVRFLSSPLFGQSPSMLNLMLGSGTAGSGLAPLFQAGGPRSMQVSLRFRF